ncbi:holin [Pediococcus acidilactici]|nr:holin [Pediococcus acidilactici]NKZ16090.1 holin [Pediococcus acidilactici]QQT96775.1 holin [Pediococcus acidilactici]
MTKVKFTKVDWHDGKLWASIIGMLILLAQQLMRLFGIDYPADWSQIIGIANTVLAILSTFGILNNVTEVKGGDNDAKIK